MKTTILGIGLLTLTTSIISCDSEPADPIIPNEEELITTVNLQLIPVNGGDTALFSFKDLDGDGGNDPVKLMPVLDTNTSYYATIELLNELESPVEDITEEILEEAEEHQFFYQSSTPNVAVAYNDLDANSFPIGISTILTTGDASTGVLTITLRHEPVKDAAGVSDGDVTNAGGETDIELTFELDVQ